MTTPPDPKTTPPPADPPNDDPEKGFWDKLTGVVDKAVNSAVDKKIADVKGTGQQRTGRNTVPKMIADLVFGPEKVDKQ